MTSVSFYKIFDNYKHLLIFQLDAFVFNDQLKIFSKQIQQEISFTEEGINIVIGIPLYTYIAKFFF